MLADSIQFLGFSAFCTGHFFTSKEERINSKALRLDALRKSRGAKFGAAV